MFKSIISKVRTIPLMFWGLLLVHVIASYYYISKQDITFDEPHYLEYAKRWLQGKPDRVVLFDDSKSPVIAICWIPRIIHQVINPTYKLSDFGYQDQVAGRFLMIIFSLFTALYVYLWCVDLYGKKGWFLPLLLLLFDPLYLAYSTIITTDLACAAFLVAILYHYRKWLLYKNKTHFLLAAIMTGIGIVTKASLLFVIILLPLIAFAHAFFTKKLKSGWVKKTFLSALIFVVVVITVINLLYYFHHSFIPLSHYSFVSNAFQKIQEYTAVAGWIPVPFPSSFVQSVDMLQRQAEIGAGTKLSTNNGVYLLGELKLQGTFWYYYLVVLFYKLPIGTMLCSLACVPLFLFKFRLKAFADSYLFLLLPVIFFWVILSFFNQFQTGIRHILLVFPLLFIGLGRLFIFLKEKGKFAKILGGVAVAYTFISVAVFYPYIIPYTNEFITNKKTVYKKILDTSIDYSQVHLDMKQFLSSHPGYKNISTVPATGKYAITMNQLFDKEKWKTSPYNWYQKIEPSGLERYVVLLYDIKETDLVKAGLKPPTRP